MKSLFIIRLRFRSDFVYDLAVCAVRVAKNVFLCVLTPNSTHSHEAGARSEAKTGPHVPSMSERDAARLVRTYRFLISGARANKTPVRTPSFAPMLKKIVVMVGATLMLMCAAQTCNERIPRDTAASHVRTHICMRARAHRANIM